MTAAFEALTTRFRARCADDLGRLREAIADPASGDDLRSMAHSLAGAAGVFGFQELSQAAAAVDDAMARGEAPSATALARLDDLLADVADG